VWCWLSLFSNGPQNSKHYRNTCLSNDTVDLSIASFSTVTSRLPFQRWLFRLTLIFTMLPRAVLLPYTSLWFFRSSRFISAVQSTRKDVARDTTFSMTVFVALEAVFSLAMVISYDPPPWPERVPLREIFVHATLVLLSSMSYILHLSSMIALIGCIRAQDANDKICRFYDRCIFTFIVIVLMTIGMVSGFSIHVATCVSGFWTVFVISEYIGIAAYLSHNLAYVELICNRVEFGDPPQRLMQANPVLEMTIY